MSWFSKPKGESKPEPKTMYQHWLIIKYVGGAKDEWQFARDEDHGPVHFWKSFFKWFFAKNTPYFVINVPHRRIVINRAHILSFDAVVREAEDES